MHAYKVAGLEDARTDMPSEPKDLGYDGRANKKKGKEAAKLERAAIPEAYMAFGQDGTESQRLLPGTCGVCVCVCLCLCL